MVWQSAQPLQVFEYMFHEGAKMVEEKLRFWKVHFQNLQKAVGGVGQYNCSFA